MKYIFKINKYKFILINNNFGLNSPFRSRACHPTVGLTSICPQTKVKDNPNLLNTSILLHIIRGK